MKITRTNVDELNAVIKLNVEKSDYSANVNNALANYRKKAKIDGFRPGHAPVGMIKKMYGAAVMIEEINKIISSRLNKYIYEENINVLGEPLPSITEQKAIDFANGEDFEFVYDIALAPEFDVKMSKRDKIAYYKIKVSDEMLDKRVEQYTRMYGSNTLVDTVESMTEMLKGIMVQVNEDGSITEGGIMNQDTAISLEFMKDEESLAKFKTAKVGDKVIFDAVKSYPNKADFASMLNISKDVAETVTSPFQIEITEINRFTSCEVNEDLFKKVYAQGDVTDETAFRAKISAEISSQLAMDSDYKFAIDAKEKFVKKCDISLPEAFLKRWIMASNKEANAEQVEKEFPMYADDIKWQIIKSKIIKDNDLKVGEEDIKEMAKQFARLQLQQYGLSNLPDEHLDGFANKILESEQERKSIIEKASETKILTHIKESVKLDEQEVEVEEFNKMFA